MAYINIQVLNISLFVILTFSLFSKCDANEFFDYELEEFNGILRKGVLNQISESIALDDTGVSGECSQDLLQWSQDLVSLKTWALKMLDAGGRPPHGLLEGNLNSLGMFEECLGISQQMKDSRVIKGQYCMARIPIPISILGVTKNMMTSLRAMMPDDSAGNQRLVNLGSGGINFNLAVCLPSSCKASDVEKTLKSALATVNITLAIEVPEDYCSVNEPRPWDAGEICGVIVLAVIIFLVVLGTLYDVWYRKVKKGDLRSQIYLLTAFSAYTNSLRLTTLSKDPGPLACLHGIRVISICWIILGHRYSLTIMFPVENLRDMISWMQSYGGMSIVASTISVDTFFLLSGLLLSYIFFRRTDNKSLRDIPMMYLHRFLRLTPVMMMTMLIQITLFAKIGRGPFWKPLNSGIDDCREYWWSMLLYVQNYVNTEHACLGQTWYLAVDMQLFILSPLLLFPILKNVKIGMAWIGAWIVAALATVFTICYLNGWMAASYAVCSGSVFGIQYNVMTFLAVGCRSPLILFLYTRGRDPDAANRQILSYLPTHMRATPWLIGIVAGYYFRIYNLREIKMNKIVVCVLWMASLAMMLAIVYGMQPLAQLTHEFSYWEDTTYLAFSRTAWTLAVLWVIFACAFGYGGPVNWFLSLRLWEFLARLSYSMYLIHFTLITYFVTSAKTIPYFSNVTWVHESFGDLLVTIIISYFMVLAFESPITILEKAMFGTEKKKHSQENLVAKTEQIARSEDEPNIVISS